MGKIYYHGWNGIPNTVYVIDHFTKKAICSFASRADAVEWIDSRLEPTRYGTYSRYMLAKQGFYPKNKKGDHQLDQDLSRID
jgi:hypothetical protein